MSGIGAPLALSLSTGGDRSFSTRIGGVRRPFTVTERTLNMAKYMATLRSTPEGLQGLVKEGFAARETYARGLIESVGAKVEAFYWTYGEDDLLIIMDSDSAGAIALSLAVSASGAYECITAPLLTSAEMDAGRARLPQYRPPGA